MNNREFMLKRICTLAGAEFDPNSDEQVASILVQRFDISLPQRNNLNASLAASASTNEIIELILKYRALVD